VNEETETSSGEDGEQRITVSRQAPCSGITPRQIIQAVDMTLKGKSLRHLNVALVDDSTMALLHGRYLNDDSPTDVMSFDLRDNRKDKTIEGEILVSVDTARRQAEELGVPLREEILRYVIHGTLHLMGYDDRTADERKQMRLAENQVLEDLKDSTLRQKWIVTEEEK